MPVKDVIDVGTEESGEVLNGVVHFESSAADTDASLNQVDKMESEKSADADDVRVGEDAGKDDMFVDAPEELNADSKDLTSSAERDGWDGVSNSPENSFSQLDNGVQDLHVLDEIKHLQAMLEKTVNEKEIISREYQEERETCSRELSDQLKILAHHQPELQENGSLLVDHPRHIAGFGDGGENIGESLTSVSDMVSECSKLIRKGLEEKSQMEGTIRQLHSVLYAKDQQIGDLYAKINELSLSQSYLDQHIEDVAMRMLESLNFVTDAEELFDDSLGGKLSLVERRAAVLAEKYNLILSQINQLRQCLHEGSLESLEFEVQDEAGYIVSALRDEVLDVKRKEEVLLQKVRNMEDENRKLVEKIDEDKMSLGASNAELGRMKLELEQEKVRLGNVKEKLSMAVTKGKSLVQQRDSLKQSLADKSRELERCLTDLQEKSSALEATVQQRDSLIHSLADKTSELEGCLTELQEKSNALEAAEVTNEELMQNENLVALLQENLSQRNALLIKFEEILSSASLPVEVQQFDLIEKYRWLMEDRNALVHISMDFQKCKDVLSFVGLPESVSASDAASMVAWLRESLQQAKIDAETLQDVIARTQEAARNKIDRLSASLSATTQENHYLQAGIDDLMFKYEEILGKEHQLKSEKEHTISLLLEESGVVANDEEGEYQELPLSDHSALIKKCFENIGKSSPGNSDADRESWERIRSLLYVKDLELTLCEEVLEDEMLVRSQEARKVSAEVEVLAKTFSELKEEKVSMQKDLERSEEKSSMLREKLSMAIKKGKGLVQDRENLKRLLDEKNTELEKLKLEIQHQESVIAECRDHMSSMSTHIESVPKLEADLVALKDERDKLEQFLLESKNMLQRVIESVDGITLPVDSFCTEPAEKVKWLAASFTGCQIAKDTTEQELIKAQEEAATLAIRLAEAHDGMKKIQLIEQDFENLKEEANKLSIQLVEAEATIRNLEDALAASHDKMSQLTEENGAIKEESDNLSNQLVEARATIRNLEDALATSHDSISLLTKEKREFEVANLNVEKDLQEAIRQEAESLSNQLMDAQATIRNLEDAMAASTNNISLLTEVKRELEVTKFNLKKNLQDAIKEASSHASNYTEACALKELLEDALSRAETSYSALVSEKEAAQVSRDNVIMKLENLKGEFSTQHSKLAEAKETIKSLEGVLSEREGNVVLLTEQRESLENELKKLQDEASLQARAQTDAFATIKSLEDALLKAENQIFMIESENKLSQQEISVLNTKLNACLEELAGSSGSLESNSLELAGYLTQIHALMHDDNLLSIMKKTYRKNCEHLKGADLILDSITSHFMELKSEALEKDNSIMTKPFPGDLGDLLSFDLEISRANGVDGDNIFSSFQKTLQRFEMKNKFILDKFAGFCTSIDGNLAALMKKLERKQEEVNVIVQEMKSLRGGIKDLETCKLEQEESIAKLEDDIVFLLSACTDATRDLELGLEKNLLHVVSVPEIDGSGRVFPEITESEAVDAGGNQKKIVCRKYVKPVEDLLSTARKVQVLNEHFEKAANAASSRIQNLENELEKVRTSSEKATEERDSYRNEIYKLGMEVEAVQNSCSNLKVSAEDCKADYEKLKAREAEVSAMYNELLQKQRETGGSLLSISEVTTLFNKISGIDIPSMGLQGNDSSSSSSYLEKLYYVLDNFPELENQVYLLSQDKEKLQSTLAAHVLENEHLREEVEVNSRYKVDSEVAKNELFELTCGLEKITQMLGVSNSIGEKESLGVDGLLAAVEKQLVNLLLEFENSKSRAHDLGTKLLVSQKVVDELATKVKFLEGSVQGRSVTKDLIQERSVFEVNTLSPGSEISEIEDAESVGKKLIPPVPSAAHVRTMRKGSTDHLVLNIDAESNPLVHTETDAEKGHKFKSLNTSGLIPNQGKMLANRIDGIWTSGCRVLMTQPRARLGVIAYWLFLHIWLFGTIIL